MTAPLPVVIVLAIALAIVLYRQRSNLRDNIISPDLIRDLVIVSLGLVVVSIALKIYAPC